VIEAIASGPTVRYRIEWLGGRHRGAVLRAARGAARLAPSLLNDPSRRDLEVVVEDRAGRIEVELRPRLPDPRFAWRVADVPAASHPTIAAALARIAGARDDDVVWDPFVGSAGELVERARLGPLRRLHGSDLDPRALAAARANLAAAGVEATLEQGDALALAPSGVTLILTNPPLGRRVHRRADLGELLERFVAHAARVLAPGGRVVWISPSPERTLAAAKRARLFGETLGPVDLGGFDGWLQRFEKR
jgi:23S rRNA G2445 N2-methylase RlmL